MKRSCKVSLKFATARKRMAINALLQAYRPAVNFYIKNLWDKPGIPPYQILENSRLSARYKSMALKQALGIVVGTKRAAKGKDISCPFFNGNAIINKMEIAVEKGRGSFDLVIRLSSLHKGHRITIPTRKTAVLNKWLAKPGAKLTQGCSLSESSMILWVDIPDLPPKTGGQVLGVDLGVNKLISDSDGHHYGREFKTIRDKIRRRKPKSQGRYRAFSERTNYINHTINLLPWAELRAIGYEDLTGLKTGKHKNRSKAFRKALAPWVYRQAINRIKLKAEENRVLPLANDPANSSRTCPVCGTVDKLNRRGEEFLCVSCGYARDADTVGAQNILARTLTTLGSLESPGPQKVM